MNGKQLQQLMPEIFKSFILVSTDGNSASTHKIRMAFIKKLMRETGETDVTRAFDKIAENYTTSSEFTDFEPASVAHYFNMMQDF